MIGLLSEVVGPQAVNFVNALHLAQARGKELKRVRTGRLQAYGEYVEVGVTGTDWEFRVAGALLAEGHPRLVKLGDYHVDVIPRGLLIILRNRDVPGVIGRVGTLLGKAKVNIDEYHQSRHASGEYALAAIRVEGDLDENIISQLEGITDVVEVVAVDLRE
jgi:D-3-phosphoglycerate dehydrogenase